MLPFVFSPTGDDLQSETLGTLHVNNLKSIERLPGCSYITVDKARLLSGFNTRMPHKPHHYIATGLSLNKDGRLLVTDMGRDTVAMYDTVGRHITTLNTQPYDYPTKAVFVKDHIAVACEHHVRLYHHRSGKSIGHVDDESLDSPRALTVDSKDQLLVADVRDRGCVIEKYQLEPTIDAEGYDCVKTVITNNTIIGGKRAPSIHQPRYMCTDQNGNLYVSDYTDHIIKVFTSRGILVDEIGFYGADLGHLCRPAGVCTDILGNVLIADSMNQRVQLYTPTTQQWSVIITTESHDHPVDLDIDQRDNTLIVLHANGKVNIYQYLWNYTCS